jgi:hypothetical protein
MASQPIVIAFRRRCSFIKDEVEGIPWLLTEAAKTKMCDLHFSTCEN